uniref:Uncharacterized protein n=1 Tax=Avena sativa TaxID=4498 RepID=A0ACD5U6Q2_AVESA
MLVLKDCCVLYLVAHFKVYVSPRPHVLMLHTADKAFEIYVTEDFACPFCLVKCGSYKGLGCHLNSSHDLFHFEFWISEEYQAVNVSLKIDAWRTENWLSVRLVLGACWCLDISVAHASVDPAHSLHGSNLSPPTVLQFGKTRKLSAERADPRNRQLLQKRQFFHSHRAQPMAVEQVFSDRDSEDEVDDDIADFEDRRMLDDFVDVTKDEKLIMHMWNSFVRKQRVLADGHIPWACEAFSRLHGQQLVQNTPLLWCWRFLMIKLWNHSLLDARAMNTCNTILEGYQKESSEPKKN